MPPGGSFAMRFTITGAAEVEHQLLGMSDRALEARPVLALIAEELKAVMGERFATEGAGEWAPLMQSTIDRKAAQGLRPEILQATGDLRRSLVEGGPGHVEHIGDNELTFGSSIPYGGFHQSGTSRMPQRVILEAGQLGRGQEMIRGMTREVQRYIVGSEGGLGQQHPVGLR